MIRRIALIFGTRPEAIKMAPLCIELAKRSGRFEPLVWVTAQHRQMLDQVLDAFELKVDRDFNIMRPGQSLTDVTINTLRALEEAFAEDRPDLVIVQGDTTTAMAGALAAFYHRIPVGHVEAGLRTWNKHAPYPEEINRRIISPLADFHWAPTEQSRQNLLAERIPEHQILVTGNTVIDALSIMVEKVRRDPPSRPEGFPEGRFDSRRRMILITGIGARTSVKGSKPSAARSPRWPTAISDCEFVYPVHLNPNVQEPVHQLLGGLPNVHLIKPLDYRPFVWAMDQCHFLLSDSGGVQEEAPFLGKPVLVMRDTTERPEAIEAGTARLVGASESRIVAEASRLLDDPEAYQTMSRSHNPFGDGRASIRIADALEQAKPAAL